MKKTMEEILQEQGLEQECIYDFLYPERKGEKQRNEKHISRSEQPSVRADGKAER